MKKALLLATVVFWTTCLFAQNFNITFSVNMNGVTDAFTTPEVNGTFNGWCGGCAQMTDVNGDNIWEITIPLAAGSYEYKFAYDSWAGQETLTPGSPCTITTDVFTNRTLSVTQDEVLSVVCWGSCTNCTGLAQMNLPVSFDDAAVEYGLIGFGGAEASTIEVDPTNANNMVAKVIKSAAAELWAGTTVTAAAQLGFATPIPFTANDTKMNVRVWSPDAGIQVRLKVEDHTNPTKSCETEATTTVAGAWETLTFDFANEAPGTAELNVSYTLDKASIFFNFGTTGAQAGEKTYYFDDVAFGEGGGGGLAQMNLPVSFDDAAVEYGLIGFGGAEASTIEVDPTDAGNMVAKVIKSATAELWAGTTVTAAAQLGFATPIPFTANDTKMNVRVWSPDAGIQVRLKVEDHTNPTKSCETEATTTVAGAWETLTFDFANEAPGTAELNLSYTLDKASIFFNFGTTGAQAGEKTYYFDDVAFGEGGGGGLAQMNLPVSFDDAAVEYGLIGFGGAEASTIEVDPTDAGNMVAKVIKSAAAELWAGTTVTAAAQLGFATPIPFTANDTKMNVRVWSPDAGIQVRLKVEDHTNPTKSCETEATTTVAGAWETLTFDFANEAPGTAELNVSYTLDKASIFFNFGTTGAQAGEKTYYFDDVAFGEGGGGGLAQMNLPVSFDDAAVEYGLIGFGGAEASTIEVDPTDAGNMVAKVIKSAAAELWAGTTVTAAAQLGFATPIPFTANDTKMNVRVWSPDAGIQVRLKVEDHTNPTKSCETEAATTVAGAWETLTFDFANEAPGTAELNLSYTLDKASIFFNFGTTGAQAGEKTYYFDDVAFGEGGGGGLAQMNLPVSFDDAAVEYGLIGFGGAEASTIEVDPTDAGNMVAKVIKSAAAELWAGTTVTAAAQLGFATPIPFTANDTKMNVRVWSPDAGIQVRLKVEDHTNPTKSCETEATTTVAGAWETLTFDFANEAPGTAELNVSYTLDKASIFFNFGTTGAQAGEKTYYFDDVAFGEGGGGGLAQMNLPVSFDDAAVEYGLIGFGGAEASTIEVDPTDAGNMVAKVIKSAAAELWAGTTVTAAAQLGFATPIPFTANDTKMNVRVWSPDAGIQVRLKVEDHTNPTKSCETEAATTVAGAWETLTFDFANEAPGTAELNLSYTLDKASIFFNFGTTGAQAGEKTYYFDDVAFGEGGGGGLAQMNLPVSFDDAAVEYGLIGFGGAEASTIEVDPTDAGNMVAKVIKSAAAELWAGTTVTAAAQLGFATPIPFTANDTKMNVRVWSPDAGIQVRLKVEDHTNPTKSCETEATTTVAGAWETLTFDFANEAPGTAELNVSYTLDKASIFFNFGTTGAQAGEKTYYFDDVAFGEGGGGGLAQMNLPVSFDDAAVEYGLIGFGGAEASTIEVDPTDAGNMVAKVIKSAAAELWAGTTVTAAAQLGFATPIPFTANDTKMNVRVWSPDAGIQVRLKVEDHTNPTKSCETEAATTVAGAWETLTFDFANEAPGTAELNLSYTLDKASIFFNFGTTGAQAGEKTYYFDDMAFGGGGTSIFNVTFQVNMANVAEAFTTPEVNGNFNNWCGGCAPMSDVNGDNIWELTIALAPGTYEYKFAYDTWAGQETLTPGSSCTITTGEFTNRALTVTQDEVLPVVCWGSCSDCGAATCDVPTNLYETNITNSSANLMWDAVVGAQVYKVRYMIENASDWTTVFARNPFKRISGLSPDTEYVWEVKTVCTREPKFESDWSSTQYFTTNPMRIGDESTQQISMEIYPNPATAYTNIQFTLQAQSRVSIKVFDVSGREIETLFDNTAESGDHSLLLNINHFAKGVYVVKLISYSGIENQKLIVQ